FEKYKSRCPVASHPAAGSTRPMFVDCGRATAALSRHEVETQPSIKPLRVRSKCGDALRTRPSCPATRRRELCRNRAEKPLDQFPWVNPEKPTGWDGSWNRPTAHAVLRHAQLPDVDHRAGV